MYVCLYRAETRACSRRVVVYPWSLLQWSILQFSLRIRSRGVFFYLGYSFFSGMFFFNQSQPWILWSNQTLFLPIRRRIKNQKHKNETKKNTAARLTRTCDTCAHTYSYKLYVYIMIQQHCAVLLHVVGTHELFSIILLCACARTLMHVPCTYNTILYILCNDKKQQQQ